MDILQFLCFLQKRIPADDIVLCQCNGISHGANFREKDPAGNNQFVVGSIDTCVPWGWFDCHSIFHPDSFARLLILISPLPPSVRVRSLTMPLPLSLMLIFQVLSPEMVTER